MGSYQIRRGDTLWGIATRLQQQGAKGSIPQLIKQIQGMNPKITNPNLIYSGDTLQLPGTISGPSRSSMPGGAFQSSSPNPVNINPPPTVSGPPSGGKYNVPYINQYRPVGAGNGYYNGPSNCGPTSMAMIARAFGYGAGLSDAQLINKLGGMGGTTAAGTGVSGIAMMARGIGKSAQTKGPGADVNWIAEQLRAGKLVVANGDYWATPPHQNESKTSGHYVAVVGQDASGNFIVRDPADQNVHTLTPAQLQHFISSNPNGGYQIAVG